MAQRKRQHEALPIQIMARPLGHIEWLCPDCGAMSGSEQIAWRRARVACRHCKHKFRIGLNFSTSPFDMPPYNARYMQEWDGGSVNRLGLRHGKPSVGRLIGRLDWICPNCNTPQAGSIEWNFGEVTCSNPECAYRYWVSLLIYSSARRIPITTPHDWIPLQGSLQNVRRTKKTDAEQLLAQEARSI